MREFVGLVRRRLQVVRQRPVDQRWNVLHQRPSAGDVQDLDAAADCEHRQILRARRRDQRDLELVASGLGVDDRRMRRFAVSRRRHVTAPREEQAVDALERGVDGHRRVDNPHLAADVEDRLFVVLELAAGGNGNKGH